MSSPHDASYGIYLGDIDRGHAESPDVSSCALPLTRALVGALEPHERLVVFGPAALRKELGDIAPGGQVAIVPLASTRGVRRPVQHDEFGVARLVASAGVDVIHFPEGDVPWRSVAPAKVVATVDDDMLVQPNLRRTLDTADAILTHSDFSRRHLERIVPHRAAAIRVVVPGLTIGDRRGTPATIRMPRFVVFDSPLAHKHADEAAEFAVEYVTERGLTEHKVVLLGAGRGEAVRGRRPDRFEPGPDANARDRIDDLVRSSRAVIVASRYEAFAGSAAEAWARGTPAVVADCKASCELLHGFPGLYHGGDYSSFAAALDRVLAIDATGYHAWTRLANLRCDWGRAATEVLSVYRTLAAPAAAVEHPQELVS